jgi:hypothetical protein
MTAYAIEAPFGTTAESKLFVFSAAEPINSFSPHEWGNSEQKLECADTKEPISSKKSKKKADKAAKVGKAAKQI